MTDPKTERMPPYIQANIAEQYLGDQSILDIILLSISQTRKEISVVLRFLGLHKQI